MDQSAGVLTYSVRGASASQHGFSLHELLTSVSVVSVLSTGTVAAMQPLLERERLTTEVNQLLTHLNLTRSEAIRRATPVTLCKSVDGVRCTEAGRWEQGWMVFVDSDNDQQIGEDEVVVRVQQSLTPGHTVELRAALARNNSITYQPSGESEKNGTFIFCGRNAAAKTVIVNFVGRARASDRTGSGDKPRCARSGAA
jgi:type IV fimbrial biogenesis protein FimT